jgi:hypothetical protein
MWSKETLLYIGGFFVVALVMGYIFGMMVLNLIDRKMSDISINMPKITVMGNDVKSFKSGNRYYKDPKDMTPTQRERFKKYAKLDKMTSEDYRNWLNLQ